MATVKLTRMPPIRAKTATRRARPPARSADSGEETRVALKEAAARAGVAAGTLRRWARDGLIPSYDGDGWSPKEVSRARLVARLRERGHSLKEIREASAEGRLAFGYVEVLSSSADGAAYTRRQASAETRLAPARTDR